MRRVAIRGGTTTGSSNSSCTSTSSSSSNLLWTNLSSSANSNSCCMMVLALTQSVRTVVQSNPYANGGLFNGYKNYARRKELSRNKGGNYYRLHHQRMWASSEALEAELTALTYPPVQRVVLPLLSPAVEAVKRLPPTVTETMPREEERNDSSDTTRRLSDLMVTAEKVAGTALASATNTGATDAVNAHEQREAALAEELRDNALSATSWASLSPNILDPVVATIAAKCYGPTCTRMQQRLLTTLLHEDHHDVVMNGATGGGKTTAMLLAMLQGARNETTGLNIFVASNLMNARRAADELRRMARTAHEAVAAHGDVTMAFGGPLLDTDASIEDYLLVGNLREDVEHYHARLKRRADDGYSSQKPPVRILIATADVLCELLFAHKLEFEHLGYLRRVYVDDAGPQLAMLPDNATEALVKARLEDPMAIELLLGTLHQLPGPHIRSIMQLACVSADLDTRAKEHLSALCLKPTATTTIMSPVHRLPATIHCVFCFRTLFGEKQREATKQKWNGMRSTSWNGSTEALETSGPHGIYKFVVEVLRRASSTLVGRVIIFIPKEHEILAVRMVLRQLGMDAKMLSEISPHLHHHHQTVVAGGGEAEGEGLSPPAGGEASSSPPWKFLLLRELEGEGVDLPLVSHVVITFPPASRSSFMHMCGRTGRLGNRGWALVLTDQEYARHCRTVAEELSVDFTSSVVRLNPQSVAGDGTAPFTNVPKAVAEQLTAPLTPYGMDPQYVVMQHYDSLSESSDMNMKREWLNDKKGFRDFQMEDYTSVPELSRRQKATMDLANDVERDPSIAVTMQEQGLLDAQFHPTARLKARIRRDSKAPRKSRRARSNFMGSTDR